MKILVVEDELTSRELLKVILDPYGTIDTVSDGVEAIKAYKQAAVVAKESSNPVKAKRYEEWAARIKKT